MEILDNCWGTRGRWEGRGREKELVPAGGDEGKEERGDGVSEEQLSQTEMKRERL